MGLRDVVGRALRAAASDLTPLHESAAFRGHFRRQGVERTETSFRLATLLNHMEAGQIGFRARPRGSSLQFEIEAWARPGSPMVNLLYTHLHTHLRLAKEVQLVVGFEVAS